MEERRATPRTRTLRGGKILFNNKHSSIDCRVRNLSPAGACLEVASVNGIPPVFELLMFGEAAPYWCERTWQTANAMGVRFRVARTDDADRRRQEHDRRLAALTPASPTAAPKGDLVRNELLTLRAAMDEIDVGIVLLDGEMRAQFINRAFRAMWRLPDAKAETKPAFVALMYHGRDSLAYAIPAAELDAYIAERVAGVRAGDEQPRDLRLTDGAVLRFQCNVLPGGGRLLSYTPVSDIVRQADELSVLREALDHVNHGVMLLDKNLNVVLANRALRKFWGVTEEQLSPKPWLPKLLRETITRSAYRIPEGQVDEFVAHRLEIIDRADSTPSTHTLSNGMTIRSQCARLPNGGRILTYYDVSDLAEHQASPLPSSTRE